VSSTFSVAAWSWLKLPVATAVIALKLALLEIAVTMFQQLATFV
jgi:hypothetical protein